MRRSESVADPATPEALGRSRWPLVGPGLLALVACSVSACAPAKLLRCQGGPAPGTLLVEGFYKVDIRFAQLDADALVTSVNHFLRELKPDKAEAFAVRRDAEEQGKVVLYRLRNIGTGDAYEFADVPVKRLGGEWKISDEGWDRIRAELESNIRVRLARPIL